MENALEQLGDGEVKTWLMTYVGPSLFNKIVNKAKQDGYVLYPSGVLIKEPYSDETIQKLGHTIIDCIFPRPVDLHLHTDVDEAFYIVRGKGLLYIEREHKHSLEQLCPGKEIYIPKLTRHSFRPNKNTFLEIRLACSGIFDSKKENCIERFNKFAQWVNYYKSS